MTEEDEIDILGDYSLDGFLTGSNEISNMNSELDILQCDYSMNSHWLLDSTSSCFYNDDSTRVSDRIKSVSPPTIINVIATRPNVAKIEPILGWSTTEIVLLERGLELFGNSAVCLSQFIGSKSPNQVKQYLKITHNKSKASISNSGVNLDNNITNHVNLDISGNKCNPDYLSIKNVRSIGDEVLDDLDIPASVEEVISVASSAKPIFKKQENTLQEKSKIKQNFGKTKQIDKNNDSRSVLKPIFRKHFNKPSNPSISKSNKISVKEGIIASMKQRLSKTKNPKQKQISWVNKKSRMHKINITRNKIKRNKNTSYGLHLITGGGKALPISETEEVIKLENKSERDSDTDVEIEVDDTQSNIRTNKTIEVIDNSTGNIIDPYMNQSNNLFDEETIIDDIDSINYLHEEIVITDADTGKCVNSNVDAFDYNFDMTKSIDLNKQLLNLEEPSAELIIDKDVITELEKYFNCEFFDGRPTKTPERYLKIRNHMLSRWNCIRPNYLSKTQARHGLKNCGDVNSIGRIHSVLEQIGAINFNCEQTTYIRPLLDLFKNNSNIVNSCNNKSESPELTQQVRARKKNKIYSNDCEGYTISHGLNTENLKKTLKLRTHYKRNGGQLINCMKFSENFRQPFQVHIELSALICMNFHSITSRNEIMGLAGGIFYNNTDHKVLHIHKYQPCQTVQQTRIDCEMCPVSHSESVTAISNDGLSVVAWVHSHPGFPPLPSLQDLHTQKEMQSCFERNGPFMGIILGPQNNELRCLSIPNISDATPYEYETQYKHHSSSIQNLQAGLKNILEIVKSYSSDMLSPNDKSPYNTNMRAIDKFLSDIKFIYNKLMPKLTNDEEEQIINLIIKTSNEINEHLGTR